MSKPVTVSAPTTPDRGDVVFSARVPAEVTRRLRHYCFNNDLLIQDVVTDLLRTWLDEEGAPTPPPTWRQR